MSKALNLIGELHQQDVDWFFAHSEERTLEAQERLIVEGESPEAVYFVLDGLLGVETPSRKQHLLTCGAGELFGEMSFLTKNPATATVFALETSRVLRFPQQAIQDKMEEDPHFSSRLYRAIALVLEKRLRLTESDRLPMQQQTTQGESASPLWRELEQQLEELKQKLGQAEAAALQHDSEIPEEVASTVEETFHNFYAFFNEALFQRTEPDSQEHKAMGKYIQQELLPYLLLTKVGERCYAKPRGYAGDYLALNMMYENIPGGTGRLGPLIDRCFLNEPGSKAVRNRRVLLGEEIMSVVKDCEDRPAAITCIASGPAAEIFDVFEQLDDPKKMFATLVDIDIQGLAFVGQRMDEMKLKRQMKLCNANLIYLATGRQQLDIKEQDLVYSIGLLDYLEDKFAVALINYLHSLLRPGGKVILGNFHPRNPSRAMMDYILKWDLIHRTEEDMDNLYAASSFKKKSTRIRFEGEQLNLFAECIK